MSKAEIITVLLSSISLVVSIISLTLSLFVQRKNLNIMISGYFKCDQIAYLKFDFVNKSRLPISIYSLSITCGPNISVWGQDSEVILYSADMAKIKSQTEQLPINLAPLSSYRCSLASKNFSPTFSQLSISASTSRGNIVCTSPIPTVEDLDTVL